MVAIERELSRRDVLKGAGALVLTKALGPYLGTPEGRAYGFFDCAAPNERVEAEIPHIRDYVRTSPDLGLCLTEGPDNLRGDPEVRAIARDAQRQGVRYAVEATCPSATNRETADEVAGVFNQVYQSPLFDGEPFRGAIVYRGARGYASRN
jgi:hypothetical protein